jgi:hypothetical protein
VRKIISIVLTLGVILGLTAFAAPVAAQVDCPDDCTPIAIRDLLGPPDFCAGAKSVYALGDANLLFPGGSTIVLPVSLTAGTDWLSVDFPADTDLSDVDPVDVVLWSDFFGGWLFATEIVVTDQHLEFRIPVGFWPSLPKGDLIEIHVWDVTNPTVDGDYCLYVDYRYDCAACEPVQFDCVEYTVSPAIHTLGFHVDFDDTYPGIAFDFIPPFKACGQDGFGTLIGADWYNDFDLILDADVLGCAPPCATASMWFEITACPPGEEIHFQFNGGGVGTYDADDIGVEFGLPAVVMPAFPWVPIVWPCELHFSSPGSYEICFYLECPAVPCLAGPQIVAEICMPFEVYQWKDAIKIPLFRKWNLISLPLVPLVDPNPIEGVLAAYQFEADIESVHYYDACGGGAWQVYSAGQTSLGTMEDGKSYWVLIDYDFATKLPGDPMDGLWVWGTPKPVPPDSPSAYPVCQGWNMVGLTGYDDGVFPMAYGGTTDVQYLWNSWTGAIYGWDPDGTLAGYAAAGSVGAQSWYSVNWMTSPNALPVGPRDGEGYWISFAYDGMIYPP